MTNVPEIRFKGFTDAWEQRKLREICEVVTGSTPPTQNQEYYNGDFLFVSPVDIQENRYVEKTKTTLTSIGFDKGRKIRKGASLFVCIGSTIGKVAQATKESITNQQINSVIGNDYMDDDFIYSSLLKASGKIQKLSATQAVPIINKSTFENIELSIACIEEQTAIGNFFRILDNVIDLHKRMLDKLKELKKGYLQQMFPQEGESVPKVRIEGFKGDWVERKLSEAVNINSGKDYKHLSTGDIPVYGTGGYMLSVNDKLSDKDAVGIGRKGTIDKPQLLEAPFWTVDTLFYAIPKTENDLYFMFSMFELINWKSFDESTGVPSLSKATIIDISRMFPSLCEQIAIGNFFRNLDTQTTAHQIKLDKLKQLKTAYLQKMFV